MFIESEYGKDPVSQASWEYAWNGKYDLMLIIDYEFMSIEFRLQQLQMLTSIIMFWSETDAPMTFLDRIFKSHNLKTLIWEKESV